MKITLKVKLSFLIISHFGLLGLYIFEFSEDLIYIISQLISNLKSGTFDLSPLKYGGFIAWMLISFGIAGVFIKKKIGWIIASLVPYSFTLVIIYITIQSKFSLVLFFTSIISIFTIYLLNSKEIVTHFNSPNRIINNIIIIPSSCAAIFILFLLSDI